MSDNNTSFDTPNLTAARENPRGEGEFSALLQPKWSHIDKDSLQAFTEQDWALLNQQRSVYMGEQKALQALEMLTAQKDSPSFGYQINNYEHCLQSATMALQDNQDEETIVVSLFHDLGFVTCNETHGTFAAELMRPYISDKNYWMLQRHMHFQTIHCPTYPGIDTEVREKWRGHSHFEWAADWVRKFDIGSIMAGMENAPLEVFEPMVHRFFGRTPRDIPLPD